MLIDTHKAIEKMIAVGNSKENAEIIVEIINSRDENLATKEDISKLRSETSSEFKSFRSETNSEFKSIKSEFKSIRSEMNTMKWMLGLVCASQLAMLSLMLAK